MKTKILLLIFGLCAGFTACTKTGTSEFTDFPIIESYMRPGEHPIIKITRQVPFSFFVNYSTDDINALSIKITHNNISNSMTPLGEGMYADNSIIIDPGERYDISFTFNSKTVSAYTYIPSSPDHFTQSATSIAMPSFDFSGGFPTSMPTMPDPVSLKWDNKDASYYIVVIENMAATLVAIRDFGDRKPPGNMFRKSPTTSSGIEIGPMEFQYYGKHRLILFHVLPDYASLYSDTQTSSQNLTNPSTSIVNGYGIFTGLNSDTLFINVTKQ
jgi:hypothetical protein